MSSDTFPRNITPAVKGSLDENEAWTSLAAVNKVFLEYCSSDFWLGDAPASNDTWGYEFRGNRIVRSAMSDLVTRGLITSNSTILFGGGSSGARGIMANVDTLVSSYLPSGATVDGVFLDSAFDIDIDPYPYTSVNMVDDQTEALLTMYFESLVSARNLTQEVYNR